MLGNVKDASKKGLGNVQEASRNGLGNVQQRSRRRPGDPFRCVQTRLDKVRSAQISSGKLRSHRFPTAQISKASTKRHSKLGVSSVHKRVLRPVFRAPNFPSRSDLKGESCRWVRFLCYLCFLREENRVWCIFHPIFLVFRFCRRISERFSGFW